MRAMKLLLTGGFLFFVVSSIARIPAFSESCGEGNDILKLMTYNIRIAHPPSKGWSETDLPAVAKVIADAKPDLVALQEVDAFTERSGKAVHQARELAEMTGLNYFFAKAIDRSEGDYGVAVLSRFPIVEARGYRLPVRDSLKSEIRALAVVKARLPDGSIVVFCSAHLDQLADEDRLLQSETMVDILNGYSDYPVILGADLNMTPENPVMDYLQENFDVGCTRCPLTFPSVNPNRTIDYFLFNQKAKGNFNLTEYKTIKEEYASDHLPIEVVLRKH
ncbi:Metal-dependent hydrolase, endonuclease/exonuclease/phosphatase family [Mariniphaga anaerophila]|uniref:Metal-dependent hydrolase, endonuclease/exonuclease/phosphatase family n=2 Tax=Mariniphaga anaerophila TaxID=1484053 RepID=A0A1M5GD09_9BACT|nr:Metal-dependent hydrolase, endonuclease/exonuclease/phosphatase family [Mariniphaga anaerophila]